jgi:hypothetical protein
LREPNKNPPPGSPDGGFLLGSGPPAVGESLSLTDEDSSDRPGEGEEETHPLFLPKLFGAASQGAWAVAEERANGRTGGRAGQLFLFFYSVAGFGFSTFSIILCVLIVKLSAYSVFRFFLTL